MLLLGTSAIGERVVAGLVNAALPLADFAGPAARIKPRDRSTHSKDWDVPEALRALPFLPSIESAFAQGYRRMVINPTYTDAELLLEYGNRALFIAGGYGSTVEDLFLGGLRYGGSDQSKAALERLVALLAASSLMTITGQVLLADMFVPAGQTVPGVDAYSEVLEVLKEGRILRVEDELTKLLDDERMSAAEVKKLLPRAAMGERAADAAVYLKVRRLRQSE